MGDYAHAPPRTQAQARRHLENYEFCQLAKELPLARAISGQHIDKTTMVRLASSYIKLHGLFPSHNGVRNYYYGDDSYWTSNHLELFEGFFFILDLKGDVLYVSETISIYLGLSQVEMTGNPLEEYIHISDLEGFRRLFSGTAGWNHMVNLRMKSSLTKRANKDTLQVSPGYKVLRVELVRKHNLIFIVCYPLASMVLSTVSVPNNSFVIITTVELRITFIDERSENLLRNFYDCEVSLKGMSLYQLVHSSDVDIIKKMHYEIFKLGAYRTPFYRMLYNQSQATFYVESDVYRYTSQSPKAMIDTITIVSSLL